ncbi:S49 family peptidase [Salinarimonas rosea]|uniref:S49 family peptidase n=1 Tax=Salinarimonas rosea TaxID=552063 RepID=UPI0004052C82|nr:S49 family peptidase [Salinarimonas rosea]
MAKRELARVLGALTATPWAITPAAYQELLGLASRDAVVLDALAAKGEREMGDAMHWYDVGSVRVIQVIGPLMRYASWFDDVCGIASYERIATYLDEALAEASVKKILLYIDSPGGMVTGCAELAQMIRKASAVKEVVAYAGGDVCSAALWIGVSADSLVVSKTSTVGSVGVVGTIVDYRRMEKAAGIDTYELVSSATPNKRPDVATDDGRAEILRSIDATAAVFLADVKDYRGWTDLETLDAVAERTGRGGVFVGAQAVARGLADAVGTFDEVLEAMGAGDGVQAVAPTGALSDARRR